MENKNNKNKSEWLIHYVMITIAVVGLCWISYYQYNIDNRKYTNKEYAHIGGITIGMDSLKAVTLIKSRMVAVIKNTDTISIKTVGDSTGYTYPHYNEEYYITIDSGKVARVFFHSDSLTDNEVKVIAKGNRFSRHKRIIYNGKTWTSFQDGKGTYIIYKN